MATVDLSIGPLDHRVFGPTDPDAPTALFVHGFLVNGTLWDPVVERLAGQGVRCVVPDWPLGAHHHPAAAGADLSPTSLARVVHELADRLDLRRVVLVGNDSGGAVCQLALAAAPTQSGAADGDGCDHGRVAGLVLTNCDAFEAFPPPLFVPLMRAARHRALVWALLQPNRLRPLRHSPLAYGMLLRRPRPAALTRAWLDPALADAGVRRDITRFARGLRGDELVDSAQWLARFTGPVRLVWGTADRSFTLASARRLAATFPRAELIEVPDVSTFVPIDQPAAVAAAILAVTATLAATPVPRSPA